jgi:hypothetical protein
MFCKGQPTGYKTYGSGKTSTQEGESGSYLRCSYQRLQANKIEPEGSKCARHAKAPQQSLNGGAPDGA